MMRLLFTSGRGPAECRIAVAKALEALRHEAEAAGLGIDVATGAGADDHGPASAVAVLIGAGADTLARTWVGSILWVCPSPVRPHHKRKNWFIGVSALPAPARARADVSAQDVRFEAFRAGGAGGQHQNKTESAVRAVHVASGLSVVVRDQRSQHRNKVAALERLSALLQAQDELARLAEQKGVQAAHDALERGRPVRRFRGPRFEGACAVLLHLPLTGRSPRSGGWGEGLGEMSEMQIRCCCSRVEDQRFARSFPPNRSPPGSDLPARWR